MKVKVLIDYSVLCNLKDIEKKYLALLREKEHSSKAEKLEGSGLPAPPEPKPNNASGEPFIPKYLPPSELPPIAPIVTETKCVNLLNEADLVPFLPKKLSKKARDFLQALRATEIKIDRSGDVFISDVKSEGNGINLIKSFLTNGKKSIEGKEAFEKAIKAAGLYHFKPSVPQPIDNKLKYWYKIGP